MTANNGSKTAAPRTRKAAAPDRAGVDRGLRDRLLRWAELMRRVKELDGQIQAALMGGVLNEEAASNALAYLDEIRGELVNGVPLL